MSLIFFLFLFSSSVHVTFHCAIVSAPIFDSPITPTRRSDHEGLLSFSSSTRRLFLSPS